eukprot:5782914-Alexandrium_andersonii.AAC.1
MISRAFLSDPPGPLKRSASAVLGKSNISFNGVGPIEKKARMLRLLLAMDHALEGLGFWLLLAIP